MSQNGKNHSEININGNVNSQFFVNKSLIFSIEILLEVFRKREFYLIHPCAFNFLGPHLDSLKIPNEVHNKNKSHLSNSNFTNYQKICSFKVLIDSFLYVDVSVIHKPTLRTFVSSSYS